MKSLRRNLFSTLGTVASVTGLLLSFESEEPLKGWQWLLLFLAILLVLVSFCFFIDDYLKNKPIILKSNIKIRDYMYNWINNEGRVAVFTRDMSWVSDRAMKDLLTNKAKRDELIICLPKRIDLTDELEKSGARIIEYPKCNYTPLSRFTIINFGRDDAKVAVGKSISNHHHVIEEYGSGEHPYFHVANDLINIIQSNN